MTRHYYSIIILFVLCFSIQARPAAAQTLLRVATPGALTGALPIYLGAKKGIFTKYGLIADKDSTITMMSQVLRINDLESLDYSYRIMKADARPDLFPTEEAIVNVLKTMSYEDPAFGAIPPYKFFDLSLIQELKSESR